MIPTTALKQTVDTLFSLFEKGEWDATKKLFSANAQILGQYGKEKSAMTIDEFILNGKQGPLAKLGNPIYLDRRVTLLGTEGFLEQHTTQLTIKGEIVKVPACLVGKFDENGAITFVEEYLDPSPIVAALMSN